MLNGTVVNDHLSPLGGADWPSNFAFFEPSTAERWLYGYLMVCVLDCCVEMAPNLVAKRLLSVRLPELIAYSNRLSHLAGCFEANGAARSATTVMRGARVL